VPSKGNEKFPITRRGASRRKKKENLTVEKKEKEKKDRYFFPQKDQRVTLELLKAQFLKKGKGTWRVTFESQKEGGFCLAVS